MNPSSFINGSARLSRTLQLIMVCTLLLSAGLFPTQTAFAKDATSGESNSGVWTELSPVGSPPNPVYSAKQVSYDAANNRLIAFFPGHPPYNGNPPGNGNEVWILTNANGLGGTPAWTKLEPTGTAPISNGSESAVYDAAANRLIVYGGCYANCSPALSDVFVLSNANGLGGTPVWSQINVTNPQDRVGHSALYDPANDLMIAFGGHYAFFGTYQNDVRILTNANGLTSPSTWTNLSPAGGPPAVRTEHSALYDLVSNRMILFGGSQTSCCYSVVEFNDTWVLANANGIGGAPAWTQLLPSGTPPAQRASSAAVYDPTNNQVLLFGGAAFDEATQTNQLFGDLWVLSNANGTGGAPAWTQLTQTGDVPSPRLNHTTAFDSINRRMIVLGGRDETDTPSNRVWVLQLGGTTLTAATTATEIYPGDSVPVDLTIQNANNLYAAQTTCTSNPTIIQPQSADFGDFIDPNNRLIGANNAAGGEWTGALSLRNPASPISGNGLFATITYVAQAPGTTDITCNSLLSDQNGFTQPVTDVGASVTVLPFGVANGAAQYQGKTSHAGITLTASGPITRTATTDGSGSFALDLKTGAYTVTASAPGYLTKTTTVNAISGQTVTLPATTLKGGDPNGDDVIDIGDATLVAANFGLNVPPGDSRADINGDGKVNIQDLAILGSNYGLSSGDQTW